MQTPLPVPTDPPPGFWIRETGHAPLPPTPLTRPFWQHARWLRVVAEEQGFLFDTLDLREIGGWLYLRVVPLVDKAGPPPPASLMPVLYETVPALRRRVRAGIAAVEADVAGRLVRRWHDEWRGELAARTAALREVDLDALTDGGLAEHYETALALGEDGSQLHFRLWGAVVVALGLLESTCRELFGWAAGRSVDLLAGTSTSSTEPARALEPLAMAARRSPRVVALLAHGAAPSDVLAADPAFAAAVADYLQRYGHRALTYDLADPTLAERPGALIGLVRDHLAEGPGDAGERARGRAARLLATAHRDLAGLGADARARFEHDLARARAAYPVREDNEFLTISTPLALLRAAALTAGRRLAARGALDDADDVFFLEAPELLDALRTGGDRRAPARRRRGERRWILDHPGPPTHGTDPGPPPPLDTLPAPVRRVNEAFWWALEQITAPAGNARTHESGARTVTGVPASAGRYTGRVRVVRDETGFDDLRAGEVLVCPVLPPVWSVLLANAGALVTDRGGPLSHAAIIAREFGVPAVVATGDATTHLHDGQPVTVDGTTGTVHVGKST